MGDLCTLGVCVSCINGLCVAPDECQCYYGYEGWDCGTPISNPRCLNGKADIPDNCVCNPGWTGRICDVPACTSGCGNGYCVDANVCECVPGWVSSSSAECDTYICKEHHSLCIACTNTACTECEMGSYLDTTKNTCCKLLSILKTHLQIDASRFTNLYVSSVTHPNVWNANGHTKSILQLRIVLVVDSLNLQMINYK